MPKRASIDYLAGLSRRVSTELTAGIDLRKTWTREAQRAPSAAQGAMRHVQTAIARGESLASAIDGAGEFFPPLFRRLVEAGEQTGHSAEIFRELAESYEERIRLRRSFRSAIAWPMFQLGCALFVVGFVIWIMGMIGGGGFDPLGFGLVGNAGLVTYLLFLACVGALGWLILDAMKRGALWVTPVQRLALKVPQVGSALSTLALSRFAWTLHLTLGAGMEVRKALSLALESTQNANYIQHRERVWASLTSGREIYETLAATGAFPPEFLDSIEVGERSGRLSETMGTLSRQYQDQARAAIAMLTKIAGFFVWALVAALIIFLIFRMFSAYAGILNDAVKMK